MADPLLFVTTYPVKPGMVDRFKEAVPEWFAFNEVNHPRVTHSALYVDADRSEATSVPGGWVLRGRRGRSGYRRSRS